ncbi:hypothetical protein BX600DRAFT_511563 [Xylariales sp. PMI_506]|nr:hypothetical protein BX600DRAFT_511563 [Xylariales sp. PMI_506]
MPFSFHRASFPVSSIGECIRGAEAVDRGFIQAEEREWARIITTAAISLPALYLLSSRRSLATRAGDRRPAPASADVSGDDVSGNNMAAMQPQSQRATGKGPTRQQRGEHPEDREPDKFKPPFGQLHQRKRVDSPPDGRNHADLNARDRNI